MVPAPDQEHREDSHITRLTLKGYNCKLVTAAKLLNWVSSPLFMKSSSVMVRFLTSGVLPAPATTNDKPVAIKSIANYLTWDDCLPESKKMMCKMT